MRTQFGIVLLVVVLSAPLAVLGQGVEGRWDLTEQSNNRSYASWLEVTRDGDNWTGRILHSGGPFGRRMERVLDKSCAF